jgi:hypothetical protein
MGVKGLEVGPGQKSWFVPDILENRKDAEPFTVQLSGVTAGEESELTNSEAAVTALTWNHVARRSSVQRQVFLRHVHAVRGYTRADGTQPKTAEELLAAIDASEVEWGKLVFFTILAAILDGGTLRAGLLDTPRPPSEL